MSFNTSTSCCENNSETTFAFLNHLQMIWTLDPEDIPTLGCMYTYAYNFGF